jgi:hypothetical protein
MLINKENFNKPVVSSLLGGLTPSQSSERSFDKNSVTIASYPRSSSTAKPRPLTPQQIDYERRVAKAFAAASDFAAEKGFYQFGGEYQVVGSSFARGYIFTTPPDSWSRVQYMLVAGTHCWLSKPFQRTDPKTLEKIAKDLVGRAESWFLQQR